MVEEKSVDKNEALFLQLVVTFQTAAYHQMGKIANPVTGKVERDLEQAQNSIDLLGMIEEKTQGNLSEREQKIIKNVLYELRMNFLEEQKKQAEKTQKEAPEAKEKKAQEKKEDQGSTP